MSAELPVKLTLDGKSFKSGLDQNIGHAKNFSDQFGNELKHSRRSVRETQHSIVGMGEAMDGSFKGAIQSFRGLAGLMASNPFLALGAAAAAVAVGIIKHWEKVEEQIGKTLERSGEKWKAAQEKFGKAMGLRPSDEESAKKMLSGAGLERQEQTLADQKQKLELMNAKVSERQAFLTDISSKTKNVGVIEMVAQQMEAASAAAEKQADLVMSLEKEVTKNKEAEQKRRDDMMKDESERQKKAEEDGINAAQKAFDAKEKLIEKESELRAKASLSKLELAADAEEKLGQIMSQKRSSRFDVADSYAKIGGEIGAQIRPGLSAADKTNQILTDTQKLLEDVRKASLSIDAKTVRQEEPAL